MISTLLMAKRSSSLFTKIKMPFTVFEGSGCKILEEADINVLSLTHFL